MYLEIDEGFDEHPKTVRLCRVLCDVNAGQYLIRLWAWACRSAKDGDLSGMEASDVEIIAKYNKCDGKLFAALTEKWSPKFGPWIDRDGDRLALHGWGERTGAAIVSMDNAAKAKKLYRLHRDGKCDRTSCPHCQKVLGQSKDSPRTDTGHGEDKTAQDKTSPDKTSPDKSRQDKKEERAGEQAPSKLRPSDPLNLEACMRAEIQREQPQVGMWIPGRFSFKDAQKLFADLGDIEKALPELERKIRLFAKDSDMQPWTIAKFVDKYNAIGLPKLEFGRAAKQPEPPERTPIKW